MSLPEARWFVPGRIEILGKHTDYAGGNVLVCAVDRGVTAVARDAETGPGEKPTVEVRSDSFADPVELFPGIDAGLPAGHWGRYVETVVDRLHLNFGNLGAVSLTVTSDLPLASGMSSSSALICAAALALADLRDHSSTPAWRKELGEDRLRLATYLAAVENGRSFGSLAGRAGVGTLGGSEDHTAMLCSNPGTVGQFDFSPIQRRRTIPWWDGWSFVVAVSGVAAEKSGAARERYNRASLLASEGLRRWRESTGRDDRSLASAVRSSPEASHHLLALTRDDAVLAARIDHFVRESEVLVPAGADAVADCDVGALGAVAQESQEAAEALLGNQVPETSCLAALARGLGAPASSSFGAGFGGSVWAVVPTADAPGFADSWLARYKAEFPGSGAAASVLVTQPGGPAVRLG